MHLFCIAFKFRMGNEQSSRRQTHDMMFDTFMYAPVSTHRTEADHSSRFIQDDVPSLLSIKKNEHLLKTAYRGVWSMEHSMTLGPIARIGQCHVYDEEQDRLIIAYGFTQNGQYLNDMWSYDITTAGWKCITNSLLSPRQYPSAVLIGREMYIFGGVQEIKFYADFHRVNIDTGKVEYIETEGESPCPRTSPMLFVKNNIIYLWSGYDGRAHGGVYSIDIHDIINVDLSQNNYQKPKWHRFQISHTGLPAPAYCAFKDRYFVFGGIDGSPIAQFIPEKGEFDPFPCTGTEPSTELSRPSLIAADEYIFLIGGEANIDFMHIFALDVKRKWWFAFHVRPDNSTLSVADGFVNKLGLFMLPREHSAAVVYSKKKRSIISIMGSRMIEPPPIFKIDLGEALASVHLRSDMIEMLVL